jgi:hypothetical protein
MFSVKERMIEVIQDQPDDASYEQIFSELAFEQMVNRGLMDVRTGKMLSDNEVQKRINML